MVAGSGAAGVLEALTEPGRLASLLATGLVSPTISDALDDLAVLARDVLDAPVALATLVDPEGQSFIGACGLDEPWSAARRTPLAYSFCQYVVADAAPFVVPDARRHPLLSSSPAVSELGLNAYAGYPIRDDDGRVLGSFCVLDTVPRAWTARELRRLEWLARIASREVAAHRTTEQLALTVRENTELIDSALEAIVSADLDGRVVGWNHHAEELLGWTAEEVIGRPVVDVLVPERLAHHCSVGFARVAAGGTPKRGGQRLRVPAVHRDGHELVVEIGLTPAVPGPDGTRVHAFLHDVSREVAATDALREERAFLRALLDSLETGVVATDTAGRPKVVNRALRRMQGLPPQGMPADDWLAHADLRHPDGSPMAPEEVPLARALAGEEVRDVETVVHQGEDEPQSFLAHGQPVRDEAGRVLGAVLAVHDITRLKRHEAEREELLAREQARLEEQRRLYDQRKQFVGVVSHELRTPLTTILAYTNLLLEATADLSAEQARMLGIIGKGATRMLGIVNDLLVLEEVDVDGVPFECVAVDLGALLHDAVEALQPAAEQGGVTLTVERRGRAVVDGDEHRLRQVVDNLLSNAIKYTPPGGRVTVSLSRDERQVVTLTVGDTGIGVLEEDRGRLFERFYRTSNARNSGIPGTGLGLAVVRTIVERHGGRVAALPAPEGTGTLFEVRLPSRLGQEPVDAGTSEA